MRRLLIKILPKSWAAALERETRKWVVACPCGGVRDLWDAGGVRYKAKGEPRTRAHCPACQTVTVQTIRRRRRADKTP